ncbi:MAG TPA: hypothetical protein ENI05_11340 [Porticoccus sp.]|nr:hypothetical protein [Porticoccus sp.]
MRSVFLLTILVAILVWDYKFSWYAGFLSRLKDSDPEYFKKYCSKPGFPPSLIVGGLMGSGAYLSMKSQDFKQELMALSEREAKRCLARTMLWVVAVILIIWL